MRSFKVLQKTLEQGFKAKLLALQIKAYTVIVSNPSYTSGTYPWSDIYWNIWIKKYYIEKYAIKICCSCWLNNPFYSVTSMLVVDYTAQSSYYSQEFECLCTIWDIIIILGVQYSKRDFNIFNLQQ